MKNCEWLINMNIYDLLSGISDYGETMSKEFCIVDALKGYGAVCTSDCKACLQAWLNNERK